MNPRWTVRVGRSQAKIAHVRTRAHGFDVGQPLDFGAKSDATSALECMLGALGADLLLRFSERCERSLIPLDEAEVRVDGTLGNALMALGVVGENGNPGLEQIVLKLSVTSPETPNALRAVWDSVQEQSPLVATLQRACALDLQLEIL